MGILCYTCLLVVSYYNSSQACGLMDKVYNMISSAMAGNVSDYKLCNLSAGKCTESSCHNAIPHPTTEQLQISVWSCDMSISRPVIGQMRLVISSLWLLLTTHATFVQDKVIMSYCSQMCQLMFLCLQGYSNEGGADIIAGDLRFC